MLKRVSVFSILFLFIFSSFSSFSLLAETKNLDYGKIKFVLGNVKVKRVSGKLETAKIDTKIFSGDKVITDLKSSAEVVIPSKIKIRIAASSEFEIKKDQINDAQERETVLGVNVGKIWASIEKLKKSEKLNIETPTAVAGVRGTIFVVNQTAEGTKLYMGEGVVNFLSKLLNKNIDVEGGLIVTIDKDGKLSEPRPMTEAEKKEMMEGIPVFIKGSSSLKDKLKSEIDSEKENLDRSQQYASRLQGEDITTGRTVRDIHGNLVRVEQIFRKSGPASFQVINLSKRDNELTFFDITFTYNQTLPENFKNWGDFFGQDDVQLEKRISLLGAKRESGKNDIIKWTGTYNSSTEEFEEEFEFNEDGKTLYADLDKIESEDSSDKIQSDGTLTLYKDKAMTQVDGKLKISIYVINNDGDILSSKFFESSNDIFSIFNTMGGEIILSSDDYMQGDIDIVGIPDIAFVIFQEIL